MVNDKTISLKLPTELYKELEGIAKKKGLFTTALIRMALKEYADKERGDDK
jgi:metal-responsive CopG/Arc/MetJ family transcriptional regulator